MQFLLVSALASSALASNLLSLPKELRVRQTDESFVPDSETIDACFSNQITCPGEYLGSLYCATPSDGDTCCSQGYACPGGSFCLIDGYCCPDGLDREECARENGVTLPDSTGESTLPDSTDDSTLPDSTDESTLPDSTDESTTPDETEVSSTAVDDIPTSTIVSISQTSMSTYTSDATSSSAAPPYFAGNTTILPTGPGGVPSQTGTTPFTGAGSINSIANGVVVAFGLGLVGALL